MLTDSWKPGHTFVAVCRERERERERAKDRERQKESERQTERERARKREGEKEREKASEEGRETEKERERRAEKTHRYFVFRAGPSQRSGFYFLIPSLLTAPKDPQPPNPFTPLHPTPGPSPGRGWSSNNMGVLWKTKADVPPAPVGGREAGGCQGSLQAGGPRTPELRRTAVPP